MPEPYKITEVRQYTETVYYNSDGTEVGPDGRVRQLVGKYNAYMQNDDWIRSWVEERTKPKRAELRGQPQNVAGQLGHYWVPNIAPNPGALVNF